MIRCNVGIPDNQPIFFKKEPSLCALKRNVSKTVRGFEQLESLGVNGIYQNECTLTSAQDKHLEG